MTISKPIYFPEWMNNENDRLNPGKPYREYFTKEAWKRYNSAGHFTGLRKDRNKGEKYL